MKFWTSTVLLRTQTPNLQGISKPFYSLFNLPPCCGGGALPFSTRKCTVKSLGRYCRTAGCDKSSHMLRQSSDFLLFFCTLLSGTLCVSLGVIDRSLSEDIRTSRSSASVFWESWFLLFCRTHNGSERKSGGWSPHLKKIIWFSNRNWIKILKCPVKRAENEEDRFWVERCCFRLRVTNTFLRCKMATIKYTLWVSPVSSIDRKSSVRVVFLSL